MRGPNPVPLVRHREHQIKRVPNRSSALHGVAIKYDLAEPVTPFATIEPCCPVVKSVIVTWKPRASGWYQDSEGVAAIHHQHVTGNRGSADFGNQRR